MLGTLSMEFEIYLLDIETVSFIIAIWPVGVTYYTITKNITNMQTILLNFTLDVGARSDTSYLDITSEEMAKFVVFLKILFFSEKTVTNF